MVSASHTRAAYPSRMCTRRRPGPERRRLAVRSRRRRLRTGVHGVPNPRGQLLEHGAAVDQAAEDALFVDQSDERSPATEDSLRPFSPGEIARVFQARPRATLKPTAQDPLST